MQTIDPTYVSFEQAKLLKEKGFNEVCKMCMTDEDHTSLPFNTGNSLHRNSKDPYYSVPEQWQVVEWLRVNHGIWIQVFISRYGIFYCNVFKKETTATVVKNPISWQVQRQLNDFQHPQEAYSAGFDYALNDLI